ncbi:MAG: phenylalanine--tRNA ligase subunit alpha [Candidatus Daviesbacteria bacterium]|nr:MAG: phenylalanine--tRNA ligase subunit alpha [Candidatus Daviesbacteria bacterium]
MDIKLKEIQQDYLNKIKTAKNLKDLDEIFLSLFGKNGEVTLLPKQFSQLDKEQLKKLGPLFNQVKQELEKVIGNRRQAIREESYKALENEEFTLPPLRWEAKQRTGHTHPLTAFEQHTAKIFNKLGFVQIDAPLIDTDYNNFEVLNIPENHPARDLWDTLYINSNLKTQNSKLLLRTHTSNSQIRALSQNKPPIRLMNIGRCFRYENVDARHEHTFEQFEIIYVDKGVSMANLQYLSEYFLKSIFGEDIKVRLKPKYYPFVEPGVGVDGLCIFCKGKGCRVCGGIGWLELAGAGMIHPNVLRAGDIDPKEYSGIAWGFGPARMAMIKYGIEDIRLFNSGELAFLEKF